MLNVSFFVRSGWPMRNAVVMRNAIPPPIGERRIAMTMSVCLSASISPELHVRTSAIFL